VVTGLARALSPWIPRFGPSPYVCFVRKHQSGYELARKLDITFDALWRFNPNFTDLEEVWGGQLLLVPQSFFAPRDPWEDLAHEFTLTPWRARAEDFVYYPQRDEYLDHTWEPPQSTELKPNSEPIRLRSGEWSAM